MLAQRERFKEWLTQKRYNARTRFRNDRIFILKRLVDDFTTRSLQRETNLIFGESFQSEIVLFERVYGHRAFTHPDFDIEAVRFGLLLQALVKSGDLEHEGISQFRLSPVAVNTIAAHELAEQKHNDNVRHNRLVLLLTIVVALSAAIQAYVAFRG